MRRIFWTLSLILGTLPLANAQTLSEYLALRKEYKIKEAAGVESLDAFIGSRIVEIKGVVKGSFKFGDKFTILLERTDGPSLDVESPVDLHWLTGGEIHARLLVKATRTEVNAPLQAKLLGAAPEQDIAPLDLRFEKRASVASRTTHHVASKHPVEWNLPASQVTPIYTNFIRRQNHNLTEKQASLIAKGIIGFSIKYGVDARLIMAMVMVESGFDPSSTSRTGAKGLGQLMPGTARWMGVNDSYDTVDNLYGTVKLMRNHLDKYRMQTASGYQSLVLALAAYNAGEGAVKRSGGVPPYRETQAYVRRVVGLYAQFAGVR